ncbi:hypothetical protein [Streptomyces sp. NPDC059783]|uniref:hypothetical protein n=1 Tax=Streptomyces sp. NPDC059783 TaxID=3346944 RepID=UPI00366263D5
MTMQAANAPDQQTTTEWHWVMTVQTPSGAINTRNATVHVPNGYTRAEVFEFVRDQFKATHGAPIVVLFFDLQPNQL